jgi:hypothetical protein
MVVAFAAGTVVVAAAAVVVIAAAVVVGATVAEVAGATDVATDAVVADAVVTDVVVAFDPQPAAIKQPVKKRGAARRRCMTRGYV